MQIRLVSASTQPTIFYGVTFPNVLPLHHLGPGATTPAAWSSQLQILTSVLHFEPPSSIHMLDRAVGVVARVQQVSMDIPQKEITVRFVDGRETSTPMNSDCVRMLLGVVDDVQGCTDNESQRNSLEGSASPGSTAGDIEDPPSGGSAKSSKFGKHKRQRSLLFSLISSLVPKSLSSPPPSPPPAAAPPRAPLPSLPVAEIVTSPPVSPRQASFPTAQSDLLRRRARATLIDVWRRHVIPTLTPQHLPAAGYVEWTLIAFASKIRAEIESFEGVKSGIKDARMAGNKHRRVQSEGRHALDFGDRNRDEGLECWRYPAPSPLSGVLSGEDTDQVVYPRQNQADEWGVRYALHPGSFDEVDVFAAKPNGHSDSLFGEHFTFGDSWDDDEPLALQLSRLGCRIPGLGSHASCVDNTHLHLDDFPVDCSNEDCPRLVDTAFDVSGCPLTPSDINDDDGSDDGQTSLRMPEDGENILAPLVTVTQSSIHSSPQSLALRTASSRPRPRTASAQYSSTPSRASLPSTPSKIYNFGFEDTPASDYITSRLECLEQVCTGLDIVRSRAHDEGWRLVRATLIGAKNGWMDAETERTLEMKAKRRAWSSGIKISAVYPTAQSPMAWDECFSMLGSPIRPPGLSSPSRRIPQACGPIVPTGLSLGIPLRSSPLALYVWGADEGQIPTPNKYGGPSPIRRTGTTEGKRSSRVTFADSPTKLFPVCEDESEAMFEHVEVSGVGFPQAVPRSVSTEHEFSLIEDLGENEKDLYFCSSRPQPRVRTTSMHPNLHTSSTPSTPTLPMFRPSTPPPSYHVAVSEDISTATTDESGGLDASALLLQPLSSLSISSPPRPPLASPPSFTPRPRSVSMPTSNPYSSTNKNRRTSFDHKDEYYEDLSQAYASPPPEGPLVVSAAPAPHEQYPRYAHVHSPTPTNKKSIGATILGRSGKEVVFERAGSEFSVGIEVALGRAEEGRVVW